MNLKTFPIVIAFTLLLRLASWAGEGMWIPLLLEQLNEKEMMEMGMRITAEDIYSINQSSMKLPFMPSAISWETGGATSSMAAIRLLRRV